MKTKGSGSKSELHMLRFRLQKIVQIMPIDFGVILYCLDPSKRSRNAVKQLVQDVSVMNELILVSRKEGSGSNRALES